MFSNLEYNRPEPKKKTAILKAQKKNFIQFGKLQLNTTNLKKNRLSVTYPSGGPVGNGLGKAVQISNELVSLLTILLQTQKIDVEEQKKLPPHDAKLFETLIKKSGLVERLHYSPHVTTIADHLKRYNVLRGGLNAGNHAPEIVTELIQLTELLSNPAIGRISKSDAGWILELLGGLCPP